ncbi:formylglycine-generating enzyme family protein [Schlesneria paludicola]|uniref:formylglycine-generating enzyme family protein n=1 Tax=Schlesneria paludicola TaxID=360056 RepID=UPI0012FA4B8E|nr:formylglycine-generating enzyme family protein [Schlesneria paludicola]
MILRSLPSMLLMSPGKSRPDSVGGRQASGLTIAALTVFVLNAGAVLRADEPKCVATPHVVTNSIGMKFVAVPAGTFQMGSPETEAGSRVDERPVHEVEISRPFLMGVYEVTQGEYQKVIGANPSYFSADGPGAKKVAGLTTDRFPVEQVSWIEADDYCKKLSELPEEIAAHRRYRLPTEAEWQYACRAGNSAPFQFGAALGSKDANINGNFPYGGASRGPFLARTTQVGSYAPNAFGLYDMHGNVAEMVGDWYGRFYYQTSPKVDPKGPEQGADRVVLGGSWGTDAARCRAGFRRSNATSGKAYFFGFRVICEQQPIEAAK